MNDLLKTTCAVMAGGQSRRMGTDKAMADVAGQPMLVRAVRLAQTVCTHVIVVGRNPPPDWPNNLPIEFILDAHDSFNGPIAGILAALQKIHADILVLACDMPLITPSTLHRLSAAHHASGNQTIATLATTQNAHGQISAEPMLGIYTPRIAPLLNEWINTGRRSLQPLLHIKNVHAWPIPHDASAQLLNVNDPQTLAHARLLLHTPPGDPQ